MAMNEMSAVPANSGTAPKEPDEPTWSARIAICGLHDVPNRNSIGGIVREETEGFEGHRGDDADGGEHRDGRTADQHPFDHQLHAVAGAQLGSDAARTTIMAPIAITMTSTVRAMRLMPRSCDVFGGRRRAPLR